MGFDDVEMTEALLENRGFFDVSGYVYTTAWMTPFFVLDDVVGVHDTFDYVVRVLNCAKDTECER